MYPKSTAAKVECIKPTPIFLMRFAEKNTVSQAQLPTILVTAVSDYQTVGTSAPARFVVTIYSELAESKNSVLVRGDIVDSGLLDWDDANQLLSDICAMYIVDHRYAHVHAFNHKPESFDYDAVLQLFSCKS